MHFKKWFEKSKEDTNPQRRKARNRKKLTGQEMSTTINFQNLEIDMPKTQGPDSRDLGTAKWIVNGKVVWTREMHKTEA
jgi:hypothetical protein